MQAQERDVVQGSGGYVREPRGQADDRRVHGVDGGHVHVSGSQRRGHRADVVQTRRTGRAVDRRARVGNVADDPGAEPVEGPGRVPGTPETNGVVAEGRRPAAAHRRPARDRVRRRRRLVHHRGHILGGTVGHRRVHGDRVQRRRHGHRQPHPQSHR